MEQQLPIPGEYLSSICEIKTLENELIATGVISEITAGYIQINDKAGSMAVARYGTMVKINVFNYRQGFRVLVGKVYISTLQFMRVTEITNLLDYERRNFFRVATSLHAVAYRRAPGPNGEVPHFSVTIRDLSLGGAMFIGDEDFKEGEALVLRVKLGHLSTEIPCVVRRASLGENNKIHVGCEFDTITDAQNGALCAYIFQRQREQINQNRR